MVLSSLVERGAAPALVKTLAFNEARLGVIADNVANIHTPGYRAQQLDRTSFQRALREALDARGSDWRAPFDVEVRGQVQTDDAGMLEITPATEPVENILFHDGTNLSLERQMSDLAETGMMQEFASTILKGYYDGVRKAIRGTVA